MLVRSLPVCFVILLVAFSTTFAENWPQFRGSGFNGVAQSDFPETWDQEKNVRWKIEVPGEGWSCPVVWGDQLFFTVAVVIDGEAPGAEQYRNGRRGSRNNAPLPTYRWDVVCLNANSGEEIWRKTPKTGKPPIPRHSSNTFATETMATDGERVYAYFGMNGLFCYDMNGNLQWQKDLGTYEMRADWGTASSPILDVDDGRLFLQIDNEVQSFLVAIDAKSGDQIWKVNRDEPSSYGTPIIWNHSQRDELIAGGQTYRSYDPATGELLWKLDMEKGRNSSTPLAVGDHLYIGTELRNRGGSDDGGGNLYAVKAGAKGDISLDPDEKSSDQIQWKIAKSGIQMASPVECAGFLYLLERRSGILHCVNAETGETAYRERIPGARAFWSSPWTDGEKIYCLDDTGTTHVLANGPELNVLHKNPLDELCWSSPAIANGAIYIRTANHLYCIAEE